MPITPNRFIQVTYATNSVAATWNVDDGTGDPFIGYPYQWNVTLTVTPQPHSSQITNPPFTYDGTSIQVGDWISSSGVGVASVQIIQITSQTSSSVSCVVEDIERFNTFSDPTSNGNGNISDGSAYLFTVIDGNPIVGPFTGGYIDSFTMTDIISRFQYRNYLKSFQSVYQSGNTFISGNLIVLNTSGTYVLAAASGFNTSAIVGQINSINIPGPGYFTYLPIGRITSNITPAMPVSSGQYAYLDPNNPGQYVGTKPDAWSKPVYIALTDVGVTSFTIATGGSSYAVGNLITLSAGTYTNPVTFLVNTVDGSGAVTAATLISAGTIQTTTTNPVAQNYAVPANGTGFTANLTYGISNGILLDRNIESTGSTGYNSQTYIVADIAARDALLPTANLGDQVFVQSDALNPSQWGHYIKTPSGMTGQWTLLIQQSASDTDSKTESETVTFSSTTPVPVAMMNPGTRVVLVTVNVTTPFNGTGMSLTVGDDGDNARIMDSTLNAINEVGIYESNTVYQYTGSETGNTTPIEIPIKIYFNFGGSTAGAATVAVSYV